MLREFLGDVLYFVLIKTSRRVPRVKKESVSGVADEQSSGVLVGFRWDTIEF